LSLAYPGDRHGYEYVKPALARLLGEWPWTRAQRGRVILRADAEQGTDSAVAYYLWAGFQVLVKGFSGRRALAWAARTPEGAWQADPARPDRWLAPAPERLRLGRRLEAYLLRWRGAGDKLAHAILLSTLGRPPFETWALYDRRGAMEVEIRADKSGLRLASRRKHSLAAQEAWLVLTDIAHNLLAWSGGWMLAGSAFAGFGPQRLVEDLLTIPGRLTFDERGRLERVALKASHPYAGEMQSCLHTLLKTFDLA
jgi:hypothetical protein